MFLLAWDARELPFTAHWWNLPQFYPIPGTMAFSEHLLGLSVITTPIIAATGNVLLAYNVAFFLSFPLCAIGAHLLTYQITRRHDLALVAGLAYGFAPYRMAQFAHIQVLSSYWMPFSLLGLHLFVQQPRWRYLVLFAAAWYLQALACGYYLFYLSVLVGLWLLWFAVGRIRWADFGRLVLAWGVAVAALVPVAYGYLKYQGAYGLRRWPDEIQSFSADVASVLTASGNLRLWGWLQTIDRPESSLFPGLAMIAGDHRRHRAGLGCGRARQHAAPAGDAAAAARRHALRPHRVGAAVVRTDRRSSSSASGCCRCARRRSRSPWRCCSP